MKTSVKILLAAACISLGAGLIYMVHGSKRTVRTPRTAFPEVIDYSETETTNEQESSDSNTETNANNPSTGAEAPASNNTPPQNTHQPSNNMPSATNTQISIPQTPPQTEPAPQPQPICAYRRMYGDKSPEEIASQSPMVVYYKNQMVDAENTYNEYIRLYSNSTHEQFRNKILQAEFAMNKAQNLYNNEYTAEVNRYQEMLNNCTQ